MELFGRSIIYTEYASIDRTNVVEALKKAITTHSENETQIDYLYNYFKGKQPILDRVKDIRPEINNKIVVNRANEIVSFKTGYLVGEPIQYVARGTDENVAEYLNILNDYMFTEHKKARDKEIAQWFYICGTAYRMILPDELDEGDDSPFEIYTLDPRSTFVVYSYDVSHKPLMGVTRVKKGNKVYYTVYTDDTKFVIHDDKIESEVSHFLGEIPIIEYPANPERLGSFEIVIELLDSINTIQSNRADGIEQFVQALMVLKGVDVEDGDFKKLKELGGVKVPLDGDIKYLIQELNQTQTQTLIDDMYQTVLTICGMPNRNGGYSTSDTGKAVIFRDGWSSAEARAKDTEGIFEQSESRFLKIAILIINVLRGTNIRLSNIDIRFTRRNYENITEKSQVLINMLNQGDIAPRLAYEYSNMFSDPELAYKMSEEWKRERDAQEEAELQKIDGEMNV